MVSLSAYDRRLKSENYDNDILGTNYFVNNDVT